MSVLLDRTEPQTLPVAAAVGIDADIIGWVPRTFSKCLGFRRRADVEHADHRADGDVVAEQADAFDEFGRAEFFFHSAEQVVG